jgi:glycosyltransferase involved in cell wall biosynthesis
VLTPQHWGGQSQALSPSQQRVAAHPQVRTHEALPYGEYRKFLSQLDVVVDLFDYTLERAYAMVTRTVIALSCGVPVVHPPFTEVAPLVERYDAGWLVDPAEPDAVGETLRTIKEDRAVVEEKARNAVRLATEVIDAGAATSPLAGIVAGWEPEES